MKKLWLLSIPIIVTLLTPIALAASTSYYAKTVVYFNVPADASFSVAMPSSYTEVTITGTSEAEATTLDWISFNFTDVPQSSLQQPYVLGDPSNAQNGALQPIFLIKNTGNVDEKFEIKAVSVPSGIGFYFNATCATGDCSGATETLTEFTAGTYQTVVSELYQGKYLNVTLWANVSAGTTAGQYSTDLYIRSVAV